MMMTRLAVMVLACAAVGCAQETSPAPGPAATQTQSQAGNVSNQPAAAAKPGDWIARSNAIATEILRRNAQLHPEGASRSGIDGFDDKITDYSPGLDQREKKLADENIAFVKEKLAEEQDPLVRQDLQIMLTRVENTRKGIDLEEQYEIPYQNASQTVFNGLRSLLDDQVKPERREKALTRLRKYAGLEPGYKPAAELIEARISEKLDNPKLVGPVKAEVEKNLQTNNLIVQGIGQLFQKYGIKGYEEPYATLQKQLAAYDEFVKAKVLSRARADFREPPAIYAFDLQQYGIDIPQEELVSLAHRAFNEIQAEMQTVAARIAKERKLPSSDYRDVVRELKKDQWEGEQILPNYEKRLAEIEDIIRRNHIVTLPARPARMRLGTPAENAQQPAPHMVPPRLLGNTGEKGEFVLPLNNPGSMSGGEGKMDDFTNAAASWTLTAHEVRPGHELQFDGMVEHGVSAARALFAFNSVNAEGWGLYSEWLIYPYMTDEGKLMSLVGRIQRATRAFTDPELQMGKVTPQQALEKLEKDVVLSPPMASQEVERYTFRAPGQATSYFYGYSRLLELRKDVQAVMGKDFNQQKFHDFILAQGLLPPELLRKAVFEGYVKKPDPGRSGLDKINYAQESR